MLTLALCKGISGTLSSGGVFTVITDDIQFILQEVKEFVAGLKLQTHLSIAMESSGSQSLAYFYSGTSELIASS